MDTSEFKKKLKIAVVGAGPAGSMTAYLMALKGHEVTLFERKREIDRKVCGEYLCPEGVALLSKLEILKKVTPHFQELHGMVLNSPSGLSIKSFFPDSKKSYKNGLSVNRKEFDKNLINLAITSGVTFLKDFQVTKVELNSKNCWDLVANDEHFEFDFLVAADGRQSKIGSLLSHISPVDTKRVAIHCFLPRKIDRGQRLGEMHILNNRRYCGLDPVSDDEVNFSIVCDSEKLKATNAIAIINDVIKDSKRLSEMFDMIDQRTEIKIVTSLKNKNHFIAGSKLAYV
ncbi:MAG: FAD-dependent monooxygenase, partial [Bdellovibrionales bacterium]|nr:FAD-dependent monooxygenase [Bdellovibrionales bacterium]